MAREIIEVARCDFPHDGHPPEATVFVEMDIRIGFLPGLTGSTEPYELDACAEHGEQLLKPARRRQPAEPPAAASAPPAPAEVTRPPVRDWAERQDRREYLTQVREWGRRHLYKVADRGRPPDWLIEKYEAEGREETEAAEAFARAAAERGEAAGRAERLGAEAAEHERQQREQAAMAGQGQQEDQAGAR